jgi:exonuclease SbcC
MLDVPSDDESESEEDSEVTEPVAEDAETDAEEEPQAKAQELPVDRAARERLSQRANDFQADFAEVREGIGSEQNLLRQAIDLIQARISRLDGEIAVEQEKIAKVETLTAMRDDLKQKNGERSHHIAMAELAAELVQGTMREVSYQFNRKVRGLVGKTLPLFTDNRYEHLQIDDDLSVRAFSSEKRDFMDLEEISSGTQRQIMLAVRLALSQELVGRAVKADQFLFLDEPFAFFDQARTRSSLTVLPTLSDQLRQIWIIGQEFPGDIDFDRHIKCERDYLNIPPLET